MSDARRIFRKGDLVVLSREGCRVFPKYLMKGKAVGTVVGFGKIPTLISIKFPHAKTPQTFHCDFWERK